MSPLEKKKALQDTASWCLERCIKLGHCEVFEDLNKMSTAQVQDFCKACVLTGEATQDEWRRVDDVYRGRAVGLDRPRGRGRLEDARASRGRRRRRICFPGERRADRAAP